MTTAARPTSEASCHWYFQDGKACYEVPRSDGQGMRPTTLRDARVLGLLPSVTTILSILRKPDLETWLQEQLCLAVLTTPRLTDEQIDAFVHRVIHVDKVHKQESQKAMDKGTEVHGALEEFCNGQKLSVPGIWDWIKPVGEFLDEFGETISVETILVGTGYAGKCDLIQRFGGGKRIWDFKTTKKLPKSAYPEHRLQLSAYANALYDADDQEEEISTGNIYISTVEPGQFVVCEHEEPWHHTYGDGFEPLLRHWQWANNYQP